MKELLQLLPYIEAKSETLAIAKGLHYLPKNLKEAHHRNKRTYKWQSKEKR